MSEIEKLVKVPKEHLNKFDIKQLDSAIYNLFLDYIDGVDIPSVANEVAEIENIQQKRVQFSKQSLEYINEMKVELELTLREIINSAIYSHINNKRL